MTTCEARNTEAEDRVQLLDSRRGERFNIPQHNPNSVRTPAAQRKYDPLWNALLEILVIPDDQKNQPDISTKPRSLIAPNSDQAEEYAAEAPLGTPGDRTYPMPAIPA